MQCLAGILVIAFTNGVFSVYDIQEDELATEEEPPFRLVNLHTLSISTSSLSTTAVSPSGDWLAFGSGLASSDLSPAEALCS